VFSMWSVPRCYKQGTKSVHFSSVREAVKERVSCQSAAVKGRLHVWHLECVIQ
jgi:hypothetical protein